MTTPSLCELCLVFHVQLLLVFRFLGQSVLVMKYRLVVGLRRKEDSMEKIRDKGEE